MWWFLLAIYLIISTLFFYLIIRYFRQDSIDKKSEIVSGILLFTICLPILILYAVLYRMIFVNIKRFIIVSIKGAKYVEYTEKDEKEKFEILERTLKKYPIRDIEIYIRKKKLEKLK